MQQIKTGDVVGAKRWPQYGSHPDTWRPPWHGEVLDIEDPRAWANTIAFPVANPDPEAVKNHVARCRMSVHGAFGSLVPVLWDFGDNGLKCHWESQSSLRPYADDYMDWWRKQENEARKFEDARQRACSAVTEAKAYLAAA